MRTIPKWPISAAIAVTLTLAACNDSEETAAEKLNSLNIVYTGFLNGGSYEERVSALSQVSQLLAELKSKFAETKAYGEWISTNHEIPDIASINAQLEKLKNGPEGCVRSLTHECLVKSVELLSRGLGGSQQARQQRELLTELVESGKITEAIAEVAKSEVNPTTHQQNLRKLLKALQAAPQSETIAQARLVAAGQYADIRLGGIRNQLQDLLTAAKDITQPLQKDQSAAPTVTDQKLVTIYTNSADRLLSEGNYRARDVAAQQIHFIQHLVAVAAHTRAKQGLANILPNLRDSDVKYLFESLGKAAYEPGNVSESLAYLDILKNRMTASDATNWDVKLSDAVYDLAVSSYVTWRNTYLTDKETLPWQAPAETLTSLPTPDDLKNISETIAKITGSTALSGLLLHEKFNLRLDVIYAEIGLFYELNKNSDMANQYFVQANQVFEEIFVAHNATLKRIRKNPETTEQAHASLSAREGLLSLVRDDLDGAIEKLEEMLAGRSTNHKIKEMMLDWTLQLAVEQERLNDVQTAIRQANPDKPADRAYMQVARAVVKSGTSDLAQQYIDSAPSGQARDSLRTLLITRLMEEQVSLAELQKVIDGFGWDQATGRPPVFAQANLAKASYRENPETDRSAFYEEALKIGLRSQEQQEEWWRSAIAFDALKTQDLNIAIQILEPSKWPPAPAFFLQAIRRSETLEQLQEILSFAVRDNLKANAGIQEAVQQQQISQQRAEENKMVAAGRVLRYFKTALEHPLLSK